MDSTTFGEMKASLASARLWRGNLFNCLCYTPTQMLNFSFHEKFKVLFNAEGSQSLAARLARNFASGASAGALSLLFVYHLDSARIRLAYAGEQSTAFTRCSLLFFCGRIRVVYL